MTAIPKEILIHSCILKAYSEDGIFGTRSLVSETLLTNVRCSVKCSRICDTQGEKIIHSGVLYYDCTNSLPADIDFINTQHKSFIVFNNNYYSISKVNYIYSGDELHHLEIELGGDE